MGDLARAVRTRDDDGNEVTENDIYHKTRKNGNECEDADAGQE